MKSRTQTTRLKPRHIKTKEDMSEVIPETIVLIGANEYPAIVIEVLGYGFRAVERASKGEDLVVRMYYYFEKPGSQTVMIGLPERNITAESDEHQKYSEQLE